MAGNQDLAILIIDMQDKWLERIVPAKLESMIPAQVEMIRYCAREGLAVAVIEYHLKLTMVGSTMPQLFNETMMLPKERFLYSDKERADGFHGEQGERLAQSLRNLGIARLCLMGVAGIGCVKDTGQGAIDHGFSIISAEQLVADPRPDGMQKFKEWMESGKGLYYPDFRDIMKDRTR
jgi:nicotinamidase-related amidase